MIIFLILCNKLTNFLKIKMRKIYKNKNIIYLLNKKYFYTLFSKI
jgi:hypothetical protein